MTKKKNWQGIDFKRLRVNAILNVSFVIRVKGNALEPQRQLWSSQTFELTLTENNHWSNVKDLIQQWPICHYEEAKNNYIPLHDWIPLLGKSPYNVLKMIMIQLLCYYYALLVLCIAAAHLSLRIMLFCALRCAFMFLFYALWWHFCSDYSILVAPTSVWNSIFCNCILWMRNNDNNITFWDLINFSRVAWLVINN